MLFRCTTAFETRELGFPQQIDEGTVWYRRQDVIVPGGYECCNLIEVKDGHYTAHYVRIRLSRMECFEQVPLTETPMALPPEQTLGATRP